MDKRVVIVTGSAGSGAGGSGKAIARKFAKAGDAVVIVDINSESGLATEKEFTDAGYKAKFVQCDISDEERVKNVIDTTLATFGKIDVLVNCAFTNYGDATVTEIPTATWDKLLAINLRGHFLMSKYAIPHMLKNKGANIVNISSIAAGFGEFANCAYGASKAGLLSLTKDIATQYGRQGLRCNAVIPGLILSRELDASIGPEMKPFFDVLDGEILLNRHGNGEDVANATYFLASDEASFITGASLNVDGGISAHNPTWSGERNLTLDYANVNSK